MAGAQRSHRQGTPHVPAPSLPDPALVLPLPLPHPSPACSDLVPSAPAQFSHAPRSSPQEPWLPAPLTATLLQLPEPAGAEEPPDQPKRPPRIRWARRGQQAQPPPALPRPVPTLGLCREQGLGSASHTPQPGCSRVTSDLERAHGGCAGRRPGARHCPGISPRPGCSHPALPRSQHRTATGRSSSASPHPAGFKSRLAGRSGTAPRSSKMPGAGTLVLVLLALCMELPPAPAQQPRAGDHGAAPAAGPLPRRAPRGRRLPPTPPAPSKAGECPAAGSGAPRPSRLYCLSDHSCPGAEKCCRRGDVRACLLPATGTARHEGWGAGGCRLQEPVGCPGDPRSPARRAPSVSPRREPRLLPPCRPQRGELRGELRQRHRLRPRGEVLRPQLLRPLPARTAR